MDTGVNYNCIREGIIPTKYYEKITEKLSGANRSNLKVQYKLPYAKICNQGYCFKNQFILVKNLTQEVILGTLFFTQIYPFKVTEIGITTKVVKINGIRKENTYFLPLIFTTFFYFNI